MAEIHVLEKSVAELIAAGEVVERPASVVKELLENALDAGSSKITVEIRDGGISYIRVADDGCGMPYEQVPKAFIRHATSKIFTAEDLNRIFTFGFRGEALASVAAMCRVEVLSRMEGSLYGTKYVIEGMEEKEYSEAGAPVGTTIIVRDLFFNTPARMKFLKRDSTEGMAVATITEKIAMANPHVSIRFIRDHKTIFTTPGNGDILAAVHAVLGGEFRSVLLPVKGEHGGIQVHGFITKPAGCKATRALQNFFINRRYVRSKTAATAVEEAYKGLLMGGKFPGCVLFVEIPPEALDVNVHPAKIEVRFSNEKLVYDSIYIAVKSALEATHLKNSSMGAQKPLSVFALKEPTYPPQAQTRLTASQYRAFVVEENKEPPTPPKQGNLPLHTAKGIEAEEGLLRNSGRYVYTPLMGGQTAPPLLGEFAIKKGEDLTLAVLPPEPKEKERKGTQTPSLPEVSGEEIKVIGQLFQTYYLVEYSGKFVMIDKHAAHERCIYNQLLADVKRGTLASRQVLLAPQIVPLPREDYTHLVHNLPRLLPYGILAEDFGDRTILVREVPLHLLKEDVEALLLKAAALFAANTHDLLPDALTALISSGACKAAIKAGSTESEREIKTLAATVLNNADIRYCPHGRPVMVEYTRNQIEKMFGRQL